MVLVTNIILFIVFHQRKRRETWCPGKDRMSMAPSTFSHKGFDFNGTNKLQIHSESFAASPRHSCKIIVSIGLVFFCLVVTWWWILFISPLDSGVVSRRSFQSPMEEDFISIADESLSKHQVSFTLEEPFSVSIISFHYCFLSHCIIK